MEKAPTLSPPATVDPAAERRRKHLAEVPGTLPFELSLTEVLAGKVAVIRGGLQALGLLDGVVSTSLDVVERRIGADARAALERDGLQHFHKVMSAAEVVTVRKEIAAALAPVSNQLVRGFLAALREPPARPYVCEYMNVRVFLPEDVVASERAMVTKEAGNMVPHSPHRDSWFEHGLNSINLWAAIGPVRPGNGMIWYPEARTTPLRRKGTQIDVSQPLGKPVSFELDPGDILVFHGDSAHSSEVNVTDETRYVLTCRLAASAPRYGDGLHWTPYYDLNMLDGPLRRFASLRSRMNRAYLRHLGRYVTDRLPKSRKGSQ